MRWSGGALGVLLCVASYAAAASPEPRASQGRGEEALRTSRGAIALAEFRTALAAARASGDVAAEGEALRGEALVHWYANRRPEAARAYEGALPLLRRGGRKVSAALVELGLGLVAFDEGRPEQAAARFKRGIVGARRAGSRELEARGVRYLARAYESRGDLTRAERCWRRRLELSDALGDPVAVAAAWESLGAVESRRGRDDRALLAYEEALAGAQATGDRPLEAAVLNDTGLVHQRLGDRRRARRLFVAAWRVASAAAAPLGLVRSLEGLAALSLAEGRPEKARRASVHARDVARREGLRSEVRDG